MKKATITKKYQMASERLVRDAYSLQNLIKAMLKRASCSSHLQIVIQKCLWDSVLVLHNPGSLCNCWLGNLLSPWEFFYGTKQFSTTHTLLNFHQYPYFMTLSIDTLFNVSLSKRARLIAMSKQRGGAG